MAAKILIIEDDQLLRKIISRKLKKEKYKVIEATDGEEGLRSAQLENPDLILLDLVLPEIDGFEVLARLKKNPNASEIPVIILSNLGDEEKVEAGLKLGAVDYLIKAQLNPGDIINKIKKVLNKKGRNPAFVKTLAGKQN
ncbi:MAG: response regulator [bacterium]|nr:response regulator [bacterium]